MPQENAPELYGLFHYIHRLTRASKQGMRTALTHRPKCHFMMLEATLMNIEARGQNGVIYVSDLAAAIRQPVPAVSRGLRTLEQDGLIERITDPKDRRKTMVRATPKGLAASRQCEEALSQYFLGVLHHLTPEQRTQLFELKDGLLDAIEAENAEQQSNLKGDNQNG